MKTVQVLRALKEHDGHPHLLAEVCNALLSLRQLLGRNKLDLFENLGESFLAAGRELFKNFDCFVIENDIATATLSPMIGDPFDSVLIE